MFKHNICGDHPKVPEGMPDFVDPLPPEFFVKPGCPPVQTAVEAITTKASPSKMAKEPMEVAVAEDQSGL